MNNLTDRRKNPLSQSIEHPKQARAEPTKTITAVIETESGIRAGLLTDISRGGLALRYVGEVGEAVVEANKTCTLTLIESNGKILIKNIPARVVRDGHTPKEYRYSLLPRNKCGVQFRELPSHMASRLDLILLNLKKSLSDRG